MEEDGPGQEDLCAHVEVLMPSFESASTNSLPQGKHRTHNRHRNVSQSPVRIGSIHNYHQISINDRREFLHNQWLHHTTHFLRILAYTTPNAVYSRSFLYSICHLSCCISHSAGIVVLFAGSYAHI